MMMAFGVQTRRRKAGKDWEYGIGKVEGKEPVRGRGGNRKRGILEQSAVLSVPASCVSRHARALARSGSFFFFFLAK